MHSVEYRLTSQLSLRNTERHRSVREVHDREVESTAGLESLLCGRTGFHLPAVINRSFRLDHSLRQDREGVSVFLFLCFFSSSYTGGFSSLHTYGEGIRFGASGSPRCACLRWGYTGEPCASTGLTREEITEPCMWMDWGYKVPGGAVHVKTYSAASVTPITPWSSSSSMQWEESFQMLSHTSQWRRRRRRSRGDIWEICWVFITPSLQTCVRDGEGAGAAGSRPDWECRSGGEIVEWEEGNTGLRLRLHPSAQPPEVRSFPHISDPASLHCAGSLWVQEGIP